MGQFGIFIFNAVSGLTNPVNLPGQFIDLIGLTGMIVITSFHAV